MKRDIERLSRQTYDVLIVGGGIYGSALAREAALRGLSVAVVDKNDFCSGTTANSLKIIHGGIRYLQQFDVLRLRQSVRERRTLMRIAPYLVRPLRCAMPTYGHGMKSRGAMFCGLLANGILSGDRNRGLPPDQRISMGRTGSRSEWLSVAPDIADPRYTGVGFWEDACAYNTERLGTAFLKAATRAGAEAANYLRVSGFRRNGRDVTGVTAVDQFTGRSIALAAKWTVVNTGPWTRTTLGLLGEAVARPSFRLALTLNLVLRRQLIPSHAVGLPAYREGWQHSRLYFFVPWRGRTVVGTHMRIFEGSPDAMRVSAEDVNAFISILNQAHPGANITPADVALVHAGLLPAEDRDVGSGEEPELLRQFCIVDHAQSDGMNGLMTVAGVKYTTARDVAARTVARLAPRLGCSLAPSASDSEPLPGGDFRDLEALITEVEAAGFSPDMAQRLASNYGTEYRDVVRLGEKDRALLKPIGEGATMILGAEVIHAIREEMGMTLADVVLRRTDLGSAGLPDDTILRRVAALMGGELGWDESRIQREIEDVKLHQSRFLVP